MFVPQHAGYSQPPLSPSLPSYDCHPDTGIDRWIDDLGDKTFRSELVDITRHEAQAIVTWWWENEHNDAKRQEREEREAWEAREQRGRGGAPASTAKIPASLAGLSRRIDACIAKSFAAGGGRGAAFVKLSTRSPKDSTLAFRAAAATYTAALEQRTAEGMDANDRIVAFSRAIASSLKCTTGEDAVWHFLHSERIWEDLKYALEAWEDGKVNVVVREWVDVPIESEWRGFVWDGKLNALGQYFHSLYFEELQDPATLEKVASNVQAFFEEIKGGIPLSRYIIDFAVTGSDRGVVLVEINPFDGVLGSFPASTGLYAWSDPADKKIMMQGAGSGNGDATGDGAGGNERPSNLHIRVQTERVSMAKVKASMRPEWTKVIFPSRFDVEEGIRATPSPSPSPSSSTPLPEGLSRLEGKDARA